MTQGNAMDGRLPGTTFEAWFPDLFDHDDAIFDRLAEVVYAVADEFGREVHFGSTTSRDDAHQADPSPPSAGAATSHAEGEPREDLGPCVRCGMDRAACWDQAPDYCCSRCKHFGPPSPSVPGSTEEASSG